MAGWLFSSRTAYSSAVRSRHSPLPNRWLFTDERLGVGLPDDPIWRAIAALPRRSGIVFRHHALSPLRRKCLAAAVATLARKRNHLLIYADPPAGFHAAGVHRSRRKARRTAPAGIVTASVHSRRELVGAFRAGADMVFLSPVFATASHPGAATLGAVRFGLIACGAGGPVIALGGMTEKRFQRLRGLGASGFAAIDFWAETSASGAV